MRKPKFSLRGVKKTGRYDYRIRINLPVCPFRVERKALHWRPNTSYRPHRIIDSVEPAGEAECVCIRVEHPSQLYITRNFIVTHNSTYVVAAVALRWLYRFPAGKVLITSADSRQLDLQIMPAITKHRNLFSGWEFLSRQIRTKEQGFLNCFTTDEASRAEGHHASPPQSPLLIICDEAKSIEEGIFQAFDRCSFTVELLISSPGLMSGRFYSAFTDQRDQYVLTQQVGLTDCPHISKERIDDVIATYGEQHPITRSTLFGEFMAEDESVKPAISLAALQGILESPPHARIDAGDVAAFCDFAAGGDENILAIRRGNQLAHLVCWRDSNTMSGIGRFILEFRRHGLKATEIWGDADGLGLPLVQSLAEAGWPINQFRGGAHAHDEKAYQNRAAEFWIGFGRMIENREVVLLRDETLIAQLTSRRTVLDSRGRVGLEKKSDMRNRGLKSPDRADAVVGAFMLGSKRGFSNSSNRPYVAESLDPMGALDRWSAQEELTPRYRMGELEELRSDLGCWPGW